MRDRPQSLPRSLTAKVTVTATTDADTDADTGTDADTDTTTESHNRSRVSIATWSRLCVVAMAVAVAVMEDSQATDTIPIGNTVLHLHQPSAVVFVVHTHNEMGNCMSPGLFLCSCVYIYISIKGAAAM